MPHSLSFYVRLDGLRHIYKFLLTGPIYFLFGISRTPFSPVPLPSQIINLCLWRMVLRSRCFISFKTSHCYTREKSWTTKNDRFENTDRTDGPIKPLNSKLTSSLTVLGIRLQIHQLFETPVSRRIISVGNSYCGWLTPLFSPRIVTSGCRHLAP